MCVYQNVSINDEAQRMDVESRYLKLLVGLVSRKHGGGTENAQTFSKVVLIFSSNPAISIIFLAGYSAKLHPGYLPIKLQQKSADASRNATALVLSHVQLRYQA